MPARFGVGVGAFEQGRGLAGGGGAHVARLGLGQPQDALGAVAEAGALLGLLGPVLLCDLQRRPGLSQLALDLLGALALGREPPDRVDPLLLRRGEPAGQLAGLPVDRARVVAVAHLGEPDRLGWLGRRPVAGAAWSGAEPGPGPVDGRGALVGRSAPVDLDGALVGWWGRRLRSGKPGAGTVGIGRGHGATTSKHARRVG